MLPGMQKWSYSLSELSKLTRHNSSCFYSITFTLHHNIMLSKETEFKGDSTFTSHIAGCQVHAIGNVTRPLFTDQVTYSQANIWDIIVL